MVRWYYLSNLTKNPKVVNGVRCGWNIILFHPNSAIHSSSYRHPLVRYQFPEKIDTLNRETLLFQPFHRKKIKKNGSENKPVDTEHSVALKPFTSSIESQSEAPSPFSPKPLLLIFFFFFSKESFVLHLHKRKRCARWWRALCYNNSALLRECPSPHGQRIHHHRRRRRFPISGSLLLHNVSVFYLFIYLYTFSVMGFWKSWFWVRFLWK